MYKSVCKRILYFSLFFLVQSISLQVQAKNVVSNSNTIEMNQMEDIETNQISENIEDKNEELNLESEEETKAEFDIPKELNGRKVYYVRKDGLGDFSSVKEALDHTIGDVTLIIYPGVYEDYLDTAGREVNLWGVDQEKCILKAETRNYFHIPLNISAGQFTNLTIYGYNARDDREVEMTNQYVRNLKEKRRAGILDINLIEDVTDDADLDKYIANMHSGYAIHIDSPAEQNHDIVFQNCKIISENNACVGIGSMPNSSITFSDCSFINTKGAICIYYHNAYESIVSGDSFFNLIQCSFYSLNGRQTLFMEAFDPSNRVFVTSQNLNVFDLNHNKASQVNLCVVNENKSVDTRDLCGLRSFVLTEESFGNDIIDLNYKY